MLGDETQDLTEKAVREMADVVRNLLEMAVGAALEQPPRTAHLASPLCTSHHCTLHVPRPTTHLPPYQSWMCLGSQESATDQHCMKALACLRELRVGCVRYEEPDGYNELLRDLKAKYDATPKSYLWMAVLQDEVSGTRHGLIRDTETEESGVSRNSAMQLTGSPDIPICTHTSCNRTSRAPR